MKYITSTGEHIVEDVKDEFTCWECVGMGYMRAAEIGGEDPECLECNGTGLNSK